MNSVELWWSVRSPYCYLAAQRLQEVCLRHQATVKLRPVWPLALRASKSQDLNQPTKQNYTFLDAARTAQFYGLAFVTPDPDPLTDDPATDRPYAVALTRACVKAEDAGDGLEFARLLSAAIFDEKGDWLGRFGKLSDRFGVNSSNLTDDACDKLIEANDLSLKAAGHWGTPMMSWKGEPFFGQDRIDILDWRMSQG